MLTLFLKDPLTQSLCLPVFLMRIYINMAIRTRAHLLSFHQSILLLVLVLLLGVFLSMIKLF